MRNEAYQKVSNSSARTEHGSHPSFSLIGYLGAAGTCAVLSPDIVQVGSVHGRIDVEIERDAIHGLIRFLLHRASSLRVVGV